MIHDWVWKDATPEHGVAYVRHVVPPGLLGHGSDLPGAFDSIFFRRIRERFFADCPPRRGD